MKRTRSLSAVIAALLIPLSLAGCSAGSESGVDMATGELAPARDGAAVMPQEDSGGDLDESSGEMVIRTKTMRLEVESTTDAVEEVRELTRSYDGTVSNMRIASGDEWVYHYDEVGNMVGDGSAVRGWVTVRVPTESYEDFVADAAELGEITFQSETTDDVTQQHVDMSARLENLQAQEERLREFFDAATDVDDMLAVEQELARVRGEIESLDAQIKYLERQAAMATVSVEFTEPADVVQPPGESWGFVEAITDGIRGAARLLTVTLTVIIATAPLWIVGLIVFFPVRAAVRRRRAAAEEKRAAAHQAPVYASQYPPPGNYPPPQQPPSAVQEQAAPEPEESSEPEAEADAVETPDETGGSDETGDDTTTGGDSPRP